VFAGFDPNAGQPFFERKRWQSLIGALLLVGGSLGTAFYMASREVDEPVEEVLVEAEIQNFEIEEELEEEPEPEPPPPEPPSSKPVKRSNKPTPQPDIQNPDAVDENPEEGDVDDQGPGYGEGGGGGGSQGGGGGTEPQKPESEQEPEQKPKPKSDKFPYNPDKPIERPADATVPKQVGGNPPVYPAELRQRNITGKVKVRLTIYKDGSVKGAKVLAKENSVDKDAEPDLFEKANKLLLKAVAAAVQTWTFKPSTYKGKPISVFLTVTIPFTLN
jgi:protein TonB